MKLNKEEYRKAEGCLRRYNYNCITIIDLRADIMSVSSPNFEGMPRSMHNISDSVFNQYVKLQEDKELQKALKEYKAVRIAFESVSADAKKVFNTYYLEQKTRWETMEKLGLSERTFVRRKRDLVYAVHKEIKKLA